MSNKQSSHCFLIFPTMLVWHWLILIILISNLFLNTFFFNLSGISRIFLNSSDGSGDPDHVSDLGKINVFLVFCLSFMFTLFWNSLLHLKNAFDNSFKILITILFIFFLKNFIGNCLDNHSFSYLTYSWDSLC